MTHQLAQAGVRRYLFYILLFGLASDLLNHGLKFIVYDLTGSEQYLSLIGSFRGIAYISVGIVAGIIVSNSSNRRYIIGHLLPFSVAAFAMYALYRWGYLSIALLFAFIVLRSASLSLHSAASSRTFYDLCGTQRLSHWVSRRSIALTSGTIISLLLLNFYVDKSAELLLVYPLMLLLCLAIYLSIPNQAQPPSAPRPFRDIPQQFIDFVRYSFGHRVLRWLLWLSFAKTFFIYWPLSTGILLKLGIEGADTRRLYLFLTLLMEGVSILAFYLLGKKSLFDNRHYLAGAVISGVGIVAFAALDALPLVVVSLAVMYVGFALCDLSSGYVLRMNLPERYLTQGISFAVLPYYLGDIVSGLFFAALLERFQAGQLLYLSGVSLLALGAISYPFLRAKTDGKQE